MNFEEVSRHEAGHCAAYVTIGIGVHAVKCAPDEGVTRYFAPDLTPAMARRQMVAVLAGPIMGDGEVQEPTWPPNPNAFQGDERELAKLSEYLGLDERGYREVLLDAYRLTASREYIRLWEALTGFLERRPTIDSRTIRKVHQITRECG